MYCANTHHKAKSTETISHIDKITEPMTPIISSHPMTSETGDPNHAGTSIFETFCIASITAAESIFFVLPFTILPSAVWLLFFSPSARNSIRQFSPSPANSFCKSLLLLIFSRLRGVSRVRFLASASEPPEVMVRQMRLNSELLPKTSRSKE